MKRKEEHLLLRQRQHTDRLQDILLLYFLQLILLLTHLLLLIAFGISSVVGLHDRLSKSTIEGYLLFDFVDDEHIRVGVVRWDDIYDSCMYRCVVFGKINRSFCSDCFSLWVDGLESIRYLPSV